ncbi:MAG TPA: HAD family hydrolase [Methanoregulaceae archaeon]|nr:HAD family hydrolase [Methanoregulaceae archaeon]
MSVAVVFDSAGTLLHTYRVAKDVLHNELLPGVETTMLTFSSPDRVLVVVHIHSRDVIEASPGLLLSQLLLDHNAGFGISCTRKVITAEEIGDMLYNDKTAMVGDLQQCIRDVWRTCSREAVVTMNSGVILNTALHCIEYTVTTGGRPFEGAKEAITALHRMGIPTFIASGDRTAKLERIADYLGIPRDRVYGVATPLVKAQIVADLKCEYDTIVMVGDSINDLCAMKMADIAILTEEQAGGKTEELYQAAEHVVKSVSEVVEIVKKLQAPGSA